MSVHDQRVERLRQAMQADGHGALLVTGEANVTYLTGFSGDSSYLLVTGDRQWFLTDGRYTEQAESECPQCELVERKETLVKTTGEVVAQAGIATLAFESPSVSHETYAGLGEELDGVELVSTTKLVETLRERKDEGEIERIRAANAIAEAAFEETVASLAAGQTEREVATRLDNAMRRRGATRASFESIVAARAHSSLPHAQATDAAIGPGDTVLIDWGAVRGLYCSDCTRTLFLEPPDAKWREVYGLVLEAQLEAIEAARPGASLKGVDAAARDHITAAGYGDRFGHGLGHSIGLRVHESPRFSRFAEGELAEGMVLTVEPGIYLPGWGGVRIEDIIVIRDDGAEVLTTVPKDLDAMILS